MKITCKKMLTLVLAVLMALAPLTGSFADTAEGGTTSRRPPEVRETLRLNTAGEKPEANRKSQTPDAEQKDKKAGKTEKAVKSIKITGSKVVAKGKKIALKATVSPAGSSQKVTWTSSNKKIATVSSGGIVTGRKAGTVKITAVSKANKKIKKTYTIQVKAKAVSKVTLNSPVQFIDLAGAKSQKITLTAKASPAKAAQSFEWSSSDKRVATVSSKGVVKAVATGTVTITATATDGSKKNASLTLEVIDSSKAEPGVITRQPENAAVYEGEKATFHVEATGTSLYYLWWVLKPGAESFEKCTGPDAETDTIQITAEAAMDGYQYCCTIVDMFGTQLQSDIVLLTVAAPLTVIAQPQSLTAAKGEDVTLRFEVSGTGLSYQWYYAFPGWDNWLPCENGTADSYTFRMTEDLDSINLYCEATDVLNNKAYSEVAVVSLYLDPAITITQQPGNVWTYIGETAIFHIEATGTKLGYQWYYWHPGDPQYTAYDGATSDTLTITVQEQDQGMYITCVVYNPVGTQVQSDDVTVSLSVRPTFRALLVASCAYEGDKALTNGYQEVKAMKFALENAVRYPYQVTTFEDGSASQVYGLISSAYAGATDSDVSLFYYTGHGGETDDHTSTYSGCLSFIDNTYITAEQLANALSAVPGKIIVILCCCHSGAHIGNNDSESETTGPSDFNKALIKAFKKYKLKKNGPTSNFGELANEKFIVLTSCKSTEQSVVFSTGSPFAMGISEALGCSWPGTGYSATSPADKDKNRIITLGECWSYAAARAKQLIPHEHNAQCYGDKNFPLFLLK